MVDPVGSAVVGVVSVAVLVVGARQVVSRLTSVAKAYDVSETVIAMTVISVGTSLPELSLHLVGSYNIVTKPLTRVEVQRISATVLGSNIGSDVVQQTLVLGLVVVAASLLQGSFGFRFSRKFLLRYYAPMMGTTLLTLVLSFDGFLSRVDGAVLVLSFVAYVGYLLVNRDEILTRQGDADPSDRPRLDLAIGVAFMILVVVSADQFLRVVEFLIAATNLTGSMIGVVTVGIVSALPEMVTAISGLRQGAEGISLGTLIGSNITNPLLAIGLGALVSTYYVPEPLILWDLPVETVTAGILLVYLLNRRRIGGLLAVPASALGFEEAATRLRNTEDRVLSVGGAVMLVVLYFVYIYVRATVFTIDF